jgi:hypothetical protein
MDAIPPVDAVKFPQLPLEASLPLGQSRLGPISDRGVKTDRLHVERAREAENT